VLLFFFFFFFFFAVLGFELELLHQPLFCEGFFKIGTHKLFAGADFEP
jgi:hypothetical protein